MKTSTILFATLIAAMSSSAFAETSYGKTRDEVKAETLRAIAAGEVGSGGEGYQALSHPHIDTRAKSADIARQAATPASDAAQ